MSFSRPAVVIAVSRNEIYAFTKPARDVITLVAGRGVDGDAHEGLTVKHRGRVRADPTQPNLRQVHLMQGELFDEVGTLGYDVAAGQLGENVTTRGIDLLALPRGTVLRFGPAVRGLPEPTGGSSDSTAQSGEASGGADPGIADGVVAGDAGGTAVAGVVAVARRATLPGPAAAAVVALVAAAEWDRVARDPGDDRPAVVVTGLRNPCAQINGFRPGLLKEVLGHDADGNLIRRAGVMAVVLHGGTIRPGDAVTADLPPLPHLPLEPV